MIDATLETQTMRLSDALVSFREEDAFAAAQARTDADREAVRAVLQDLVARSKLRREGPRFFRVRGT